jgi:hypothetical protein
VSSSELIRWSGMAAVAGGVTLVVSGLVSILGVDFSDLGQNLGALIFASLLGMLAAVLLLLGLVGLYASQARAAGILGLVGFFLAFLGTVLVAGFDWAGAFLLPDAADEASRIFEATPPGFVVTFLLFAVGWLVFGLAMLRARIYPQAVALALVVGAVANLVPVAGTEFIFAVAIAWAGFLLFTGRGATGAQPLSRAN